MKLKLILSVSILLLGSVAMAAGDGIPWGTISSQLANLGLLIGGLFWPKISSAIFGGAKTVKYFQQPNFFTTSGEIEKKIQASQVQRGIKILVYPILLLLIIELLYNGTNLAFQSRQQTCNSRCLSSIFVSSTDLDFPITMPLINS